MDETFILYKGLNGRRFQCKHTGQGARLITFKRKELTKAITEVGCNFYSTGKPRYWPTNRNIVPNLLDLS